MAAIPWWHRPPEEKLNQIKLEICCVLDREFAFTQLTQKELAKKLGTSQSNISRVENKKIEELTFNQLFRFLAVVNPNFKILVSPR